MLAWSINLFRVAGIRLAVHGSFLLLLAWVATQGWAEEGWAGAAANVAVVCILFTCVVLHELGHSLTARRFGIGVRRILLLPIGGMAEFEAIPRQPRAELLITLAGPAVNFAIVLLLLPFVPYRQFNLNDGLPVNLTGLGLALFYLNLIMGGFNLLPVFPMDGGRILRALLAMHRPYLEATKWAVNIGKVGAAAGVVYMGFIQGHFLSALLFSFIFVAGDMEYRAVQRQAQAEVDWRLIMQRMKAIEEYRKSREPAADLSDGPN